MLGPKICGVKDVYNASGLMPTVLEFHSWTHYQVHLLQEETFLRDFAWFS